MTKPPPAGTLWTVKDPKAKAARKTGGAKCGRPKRAKAPSRRDGARAALAAAACIAATAAFALGAAFLRELRAVPAADLPSAAVAPAEKPVQDETPAVTGRPLPLEAPPAAPPPEEKRPAPPPSVVRTPAPSRPVAGGGSAPSGRRTAAPAASRPAAPPERPDPRRRKGRVAFVIDDAGNNLRELGPFLDLPFPLTVAVLPGLPHSAEAARRIRAAGKEVILHQSMEAVGGQNPGPGAIYLGMGPDEVRRVLAANLSEVGPVVGMNNHQGSKITADRATMEVVLAFCRDNGIYFLDSRTTADSAARDAAAKLGMGIRERDVFVDNIQERAAMIRFVQEGLQKAEKKGAAVMIGHAWSSELADTLSQLYPELVEQGFSLSTISQIMMGTYEDEDTGD